MATSSIPQRARRSTCLAGFSLCLARRKGVSEDALNQILATAASKLDTETNLVSARDALANARSFRLTAYDAVYLGLARREGLPLATLDKKSLRAAAAK